MRFLLLVLCVLTCMISSCSQEEIFVEDISSSVQTKSFISSDSTYFVKDGVLYFSSVEDYFDFSESIKQFSCDELEQWEKRNHFVSYYTYVQDIMKEIDQALEVGDTDKFNLLLDTYSNYVYLSSDNEVYPRISLSSYQHIANKDGIFFINNTMNKVIDNTISNGFKTIDYAEANGVNTYAIQEDFQLKELEYRKSDNTKSILAWCKIVRNVAFSSSQGDNTTQYQLQIQLRGRHNKKIGGWSTYATEHDISNIIGLFNDIPVSIKPDGTIGNVQSLYEFRHDATDHTPREKYSLLEYNLGVAVKNYNVPMKAPVCIHFKARSAGTTPQGLGYNYYRGSYDKSSICPVHGFVENMTK